MWTVNTIKDAVRATGSHWFDPDTMRFFGTRVLPTVWQGPGGVFFVTSDKRFDGKRGHTVRQFKPEDSSVHSSTEIGMMSEKNARTRASQLAWGTGEEKTQLTSEPFRAVSVLEQLCADLKTHGSASEVSAADARILIRAAARHHALMEDMCNGTLQTDDSGESSEVNRLRARISRLASDVGASGAMYSGDPRGCTVKLTFPDGFTNDWGKTGYCVPTSLREESEV